MARMPWHSPNWGGNRRAPGATAGNNGGAVPGKPSKRDRYNTQIIEATLNGEDEHPFDIIKQAYLDKSLPLAQRAYFAEKALPYCMPKPIAQKLKQSDPLANMTAAEKRKALENALKRLEQHDIQAQAVVDSVKAES